MFSLILHDSGSGLRLGISLAMSVSQESIALFHHSILFFIRL